MRKPLPWIALAALAASGLGLQGCVVAAAGAGAAGGYQAKKHGYEVQSPVEKDEAGGYKPQSPVVHEESKDEAHYPESE